MEFEQLEADIYNIFLQEWLEQQRIMADRAAAVRQMQGALRSAPFYDGTGLWITFAFKWGNWCPLAWIGGINDHITPDFGHPDPRTGCGAS